MSEDTKVVGTTEDKSHLIIEITQECYDEVENIVARATERGLDTSFEGWVCRLTIQHAKVQNKLWDNSDDSSLLKRAKQGHRPSQIAIISSLGLKLSDEQVKSFFATMK